MIPDLCFKKTWSQIHFRAVIIHERGSHVPWGTLYQKAYGSNWLLELRLSSTESEIVNMGTEEKRYAEWCAREYIWNLVERGLLKPPPPQPSSRESGSRQINHRPTPPPPDCLGKHDAGTAAPQPPAVDEHATAAATQLPVPLLGPVTT